MILQQFIYVKELDDFNFRLKKHLKTLFLQKEEYTEVLNSKHKLKRQNLIKMWFIR